jgi:AcrR family transcriptional regulator
VRQAETPDARERLLQATIEYVSQHGIIDRSLRQLATEIGTSHRMLVYHFGSKEGLLVEVVRAVEAQQREAMEALSADEALEPAEQFRRLARRLTDPKLRGSERLFFELYAQALHGRAPASALLPEVVHVWLEPLTELSIRYGVPPERAADHARLMLAVARGLLLDLVATGERRAIDRAFERFVELCEASLLAHANPGS